MASMILMPWFAFAEGEEAEETETATIDYEEADVDYESEDGFIFNTCFMNVDFPPTVYTVDDDAEYDANEETALVSRLMEDYEAAYSSAIGNAACGEMNDFTESVEMADCAAEGKVVTEISESFAGETTLGDEARVVSLYKSSCCMIVKEHVQYKSTESGTEQFITYECVDLRSIYHKDPSQCEIDSICEKRQWIIGDSGASIIKIYVKQIYIWAAGTIGFISVIIIVINGIRISVSGASGDITQAKERILQSISGLVLLFLSGLLLYTINPTFFS